MRHSPAGSLGDVSAAGVGEGVLATVSVEVWGAATESTATSTTAQIKQIAARVPLPERTGIVGPHKARRILLTLSDVLSLLCTLAHILRQLDALACWLPPRRGGGDRSSQREVGANSRGNSNSPSVTYSNTAPASCNSYIVVRSATLEWGLMLRIRSIMRGFLCFLLRSFEFLHGNHVLPPKFFIQGMDSFYKLRSQIGRRFLRIPRWISSLGSGLCSR